MAFRGLKLCFIIDNDILHFSVYLSIVSISLSVKFQSRVYLFACWIIFLLLLVQCLCLMCTCKYVLACINVLCVPEWRPEHILSCCLWHCLLTHSPTSISLVLFLRLFFLGPLHAMGLHNHIWLFPWVLGIRLRNLFLQGKYLTDWLSSQPL